MFVHKDYTDIGWKVSFKRRGSLDGPRAIVTGIVIKRVEKYFTVLTERYQDDPDGLVRDYFEVQWGDLILEEKATIEEMLTSEHQEIRNIVLNAR